MITFIVSILLLIVGYFTYGKFVERVFVTDRKRQTPAYSMRDNIDYVPMNTTRNSLIQLLNIAGVGPIFGPILAHFTVRSPSFGSWLGVFSPVRCMII